MCPEITENKCYVINRCIFFQISEVNILYILTDMFSTCSAGVHRWSK